MFDIEYDRILVKIVHATPYALTPTYATEGSMCFDIYTPHDIHLTFNNQKAIVETGLKLQPPEGYGIKIHSRSGHGFSKNIRLSNCTGLIDSDFTGEIKIALRLDSKNPFEEHFFQAGSRIAQGEVVPIHKATFMEVDKLEDTIRKDGGFGSTGD